MTYSRWDVTSILHTGKGETRRGMSVHMFGARASTVLYISGVYMCICVGGMVRTICFLSLFLHFHLNSSPIFNYFCL